jgi:hypothetical protein
LFFGGGDGEAGEEDDNAVHDVEGGDACVSMILPTKK